MFLLITNVIRKPAIFALRHKKIWLILAMMLAAMIVVGRAFSCDEIGIGVYGSFDTMISRPSRIVLSVLMYIGLAAILFNVLLILAYYMEHLSTVALKRHPATTNLSCNLEKDDARGLNSNRFERSVSNMTVPQMMVVLLVFWSPYIIAYFPGCVYHDSADQLRQFFGAIPLSAHHPLITTYLYGGLVSLGRMLGSDTFGVFLCTIAQTAALSFACSRVISCARSVWGSASLPVVLIPLLIFAIVPLWPSAATSIKKDAFFYAAFSLLVVHLVEMMLIMRSGSKSTKTIALKSASIAIFSLLCALIRNDGLIFSAFAIACTLLFVFISPGFRQKKKVFGFCTVGLLAVFALYFVGYHSIVMKSLNAQEGSSVEALTIPIQQTARFYIQAKEDVTDGIEKGVSRVLITEGLTEEVYNPLVSDNIKFEFVQDDIDTSDLLAFACSCFEMSTAHPLLFAEAFIDQTLGWWHPEKLGKPDWTVGDMGLYQNTPKTELYSQVIDIEMPFYDSDAVQLFKQVIGCFGYIPTIGLMVYPAIYCWALLIMAAFLLSHKRQKELLILAPFFLYFAICIASPVNGLTRYAVPIITCMPILITWVLAYRPHEISCDSH